MSDVTKLTDMGVPADVVASWMEHASLTGVTSEASLPRGVTKIEPYVSRIGHRCFVVHTSGDRLDLPNLVMETADRIVARGLVVKDRYEICSISMFRCDGCGFNVERKDAYGIIGSACGRCVRCDGVPDMRESYRRGFNAGLQAMAMAVRDAATDAVQEKRR